MSKDIIIQQGGVDQQLDGVEMLRTNAADSGTVDWFPYSEAQLEDLSATANNTYTPESGVYGFRMVAVSVPATSITGKGPDGNDYTVTTDGEGHIVEAKVPSEIRVVTPPNYVGPYVAGDTLDFTGIEVKAYDGNGNLMQSIAYADLVFPRNQAYYDPNGDPVDVSYPYVGTGEVQITSLGSIRQALERAISEGDFVDGGGMEALMNYADTFDGQHWGVANALRMPVEDAYEGWSPLGFTVFLYDSVGDTITLGSVRSITQSIMTQGRKKAGESAITILAARANEPSQVYNDKFIGETVQNLTYKMSSLNVTTIIPADAMKDHIPVRWQIPETGTYLETTFDIAVVDV